MLRLLRKIGMPTSRSAGIQRMSNQPTLQLPRQKLAKGRRSWPNKGLELTAYSVRSCLAPASSRSSGLALSLKIRLGSRPDSPENRLFLAIPPTKFKIGARIVKS